MSDRQIAGPASNTQAIDVPSAGSLSCRVEMPQYDCLIYRISISGPTGSICKVYAGTGITNAAYRDISYFGQLDSADYPAGLYLSSADNLIAVWYTVTASTSQPTASLSNPLPITGSGAGACTVVVEYEPAP